jgi:hypothetical protein
MDMGLTSLIHVVGENSRDADQLTGDSTSATHEHKNEDCTAEAGY